jgi:hypothetical protein
LTSSIDVYDIYGKCNPPPQLQDSGIDDKYDYVNIGG